ncbi:transcription initiation factor TFIID subunit 11 [Malus sylvestris]|uniref:transcription initiation factor TFIID subunit 11 n=1 Tax=Malus sylvestris TaxID=3752 RepID=UPI0021AC6BCF|nr:transcription initiation factor TFIID subunit 11 [Malus sylvestris]
MKQQSKDPFEAAFEEQEDDSPPDSPAVAEAARAAFGALEEDDPLLVPGPSSSSAPSAAAPKATAITRTRTTPTAAATAPSASARPAVKNKDDDDDDDEDNMDVELGKFSATGDPDKMAKMQAILSQFSEEQMSRYESFRRAGFQRANMKRLLTSISGTPKISAPMNIVVSGIAKMFVGELVETARIVMSERKESGPIRPCHLREAYRRLKLEGKVPKRSQSRLFR